MSIEKITNKQVLEVIKNPVVSNKTVESRKQKIRKELESIDVDMLMGFQREMESYVDKVSLLAGKISDGVDLDLVSNEDLMGEIVSLRTIKEFLDVRNDMIKELAFAKITEMLEAEGVEDAENSNGRLDVPELGKSFCREGAGAGNPTVDIEKLKEVFGDDASNFLTTEVIPEQRVEKLDEKALMEFIVDNPSAVGLLREATVPGKPRSPRFVIRDIKV